MRTQVIQRTCIRRRVKAELAAVLLVATCLPWGLALAQQGDLLNMVIEPVPLDADLSNSSPVSASYPALTRPDASPRANASDSDAVQAYRQAVAEIERREGQFAPALMESLLGLGQQLQQQGEHVEAIAVLERAEHISRINNGLYDRGLMPIVESLIVSYLAVNDFASVNDREQYLAFLSRKLAEETPASVEAPLLAGLANSNMTTFGLALIETPEEAGLPFDYKALRMRNTGTPFAARYYGVSSLSRAKGNYAAAIVAMSNTEDYDAGALLDLERRLLETTFLLGFRREFAESPHYYMTAARVAANMPNQWNYLRRNSEGYDTGLEAFARMYAHLDNMPGATPQLRIALQLENADWHLLFGRPNAAREAYLQAWHNAQQLGLDDVALADLFHTAALVQLPVFTARPNSREKFGIAADAELARDGYVDLAFSVSRSGSVRGIRTLAKSVDTSYAVEEQLRRYLKNAPIRPQVRDGEVVVRNDVRMRFYYTFL